MSNRRHIRLTAWALTAGTALAIGGAPQALAGGLAGTNGPTRAPCTADWPTFQHDAAHTGAGCGAITTANASTLVPGWFAPTGNTVTAEPAVAGGSVYVGDGAGTFYALSASTGKQLWTFDVTPYDHHATSYGVITSSATYAKGVPGRKGPMVVFGGGGSVFALDAGTGTLLWHTDLAPSQPDGPDEVESSPQVVTIDSRPLVVVGLDTNESTDGTSGGVVALDAATGAPVWSFEPGTATVVTGGLPEASGNGCSDVWSSPAVDPSTDGGLVVFGTGNCPDGQASIEAVSLRSGALRWDFVEPPANHGTDDDFGSSAVLTRLGDEPVVVEAGKSGWIYVLDETTGATVRSAQVAQPGQTGDALAGAIGGFIGSLAEARVGSDQVVFGDSAIPAPFTGDGVSSAGITPDTSIASDPTRVSSLHAYDLSTGKILWHQPLQAPAYAPVTTVGGVLFAPSTTSFSINAFSAANGAPLWSFPLASSPSGGVAVAGSDIIFGTGTYQSPGQPVPPQVTGVWMFHLPGS